MKSAFKPINLSDKGELLGLDSRIVVNKRQEDVLENKLKKEEAVKNSFFLTLFLSLFTFSLSLPFSLAL